MPYVIEDISFTNSVASSNMDIRRTTSFLTSQSMGTNDICILVVHDDPMYRNIIFEMLQNCNHYEVLKFQKIGDALHTLREKKDRLAMIITDVHQSNSNGFEILNYIEKGCKLQVISMIPQENAKVVSVGLSSSAKLYFVKSLGENEFKTLWQQAYMEEKAKDASFQWASVIHERENETSLESESSIQEERQIDQKHKRKALEGTDEQGEEKYDLPNKKKQRVVWNEQMHHKFLKAVEQLGHDRAYPKKIVEIMNVPGLTRENVASHLQKYRLHLKRAQEEMQSTRSVFGINSPPPLRCLQSSHSDFNSCEPNYLWCHTQNFKYIPKSSPTNVPIPILNFLYPETSTSISNFGQQKFFVACNHESLKSTFANNNCLISETENKTSSVNNQCPISKTENNTSSISIPMPLSNFSPNHCETSTRTSNLVCPETLLTPYTRNSTLLVRGIPLPNSSNNNTYVGFKLTDNGISFECGKNSVQKNDDNTVDNPNSSDEGKGNESSDKFPSTETDDNDKQQIYLPPAECEIEDLLDEIGEGATSPPIIFDN